MSTLKNITLKDYDTVVATTQAAINNAMAVYINNNPKDFAIYAIVDDGLNVKELTTDPAKANCYLKGTIALEMDANQNYINIIDLKTDKGAQHVGYNITIQGGEFYVNVEDFPHHTKPQGDNVWIIGMFVNLSMEDVEKSKLPDSIKKQLENVDENMFSIQQLCMDLNTAALNSSKENAFPNFMKATVTQMMSLYLAVQQKDNKPLFGVSAKFKDASVTPPTFVPTAVDFCVTPYTDANGNQSNPSLDTLNYLVMTNKNKAPKTVPTSFPFNWVDDINVPGVIAIKHDLFAGFIIDKMNPVLKALCPQIKCNADLFTVSILPADSSPVFQKVTDGQGRVATYTYQTKDVNHIPYNPHYDASMEVDYKMKCDVYLVDDDIRLKGAITVSGQTSTQSYRSPNGTTEEMDDTTFYWELDIQVYMDSTNAGQLDFKVASSDFNQPPVITRKDKPFRVTDTNDIGDIRKTIMPTVEATVMKSLAGVLKNPGHFVFPGGKTFLFKNPQFSTTTDLASEITYNM